MQKPQETATALLPRSRAEMVRCCRRNALVAIGFSMQNSYGCRVRPSAQWELYGVACYSPVMHTPYSNAAQYLRMSTDQQDLSIQIQMDAIANYAAANGLNLVATYEDEAKSGLRIANRNAMKRLMTDVMDPLCSFRTVLVYDVSRWGRFQNTDASAYYDYHCRLNGVRVVYVAEVFGDETGPFSALIKNLKRAMAAEYSRELAVKVRGGLERVIAAGHSAGGCPAIGLVRQAVSREGVPRMVLRPNERKAIQSDRVMLVPGPADEVALVRQIFEMYANTSANVNDLVRWLNATGRQTQRGRPFTRQIVDRLLRYEPFIGNYVWGKRFQTPRGSRPASPEAHLRRDGVIEPIIGMDVWQVVQQKLRHRSRIRKSEEQLLSELAEALRRSPDLTAAELSLFGCAPGQTYQKAFGSMEAAYALAGRASDIVERSGRARTERTKVMTRAFQTEIADQLRSAGMEVRCDLQSHVIEIGGRTRVQVFLSWRRSQTVEPAWFVPRRRLARSDWRLIVRLDDAGQAIDQFLVPETGRKEFPMLVRPEHVAGLANLFVRGADDIVARIGAQRQNIA